MNQEVYVTFRFIGASVDPSYVTDILEITPSVFFRKDDPIKKGSNKKRQTNLWALESSLSPNESLENHIALLLAKLEAKCEAIVMLKRLGYSGEFFCSLHILTPSRLLLADSLLKRLNQLGLSLVIDLYQISEETKPKQP